MVDRVHSLFADVLRIAVDTSCRPNLTGQHTALRQRCDVFLATFRRWRAPHTSKRPLSQRRRERGNYYRDNGQHEELKLSFGDTESYLRSLEMVGEVGVLDHFSVPHVAQLIDKAINSI
jgi:predicted enzyme involved in methoxymalonyl-ACP biosynthesis